LLEFFISLKDLLVKGLLLSVEFGIDDGELFGDMVVGGLDGGVKLESGGCNGIIDVFVG